MQLWLLSYQRVDVLLDVPDSTVNCLRPSAATVDVEHPSASSFQLSYQRGRADRWCEPTVEAGRVGCSEKPLWWRCCPL